MPWGINFGPTQSFLGSILASIFGAIQQVFVVIWNALVASFHFLLSGLIVVANFMLRMLGHVGRFFRNVWDKWIQRGILKLLELYQRLVEKLQRFLEPVLRVLRRIREILDYWYNRLFGPILQVIQQVRGVLQIFRVFNLKFAKALDERLLRLESKITQPYLILRAKINEVITWITMGTDPRMTISPHTLLGSIARIFGALASLTAGRFSRPLSAPQEVRQQFDRDRFKPDVILARSAERERNGLHPEDRKIHDGLRAELATFTAQT